MLFEKKLFSLKITESKQRRIVLGTPKNKKVVMLVNENAL